MKLFYETNYHLRTLDFDRFDRLTPTSILNSFQDVAGFHAESLGIGFEAMVEKGYYWVVLREKITICKNAEPSSMIKVETWPLKKGRLDFRREYKMLDENDNILAYGSSLWVLIKTDTRRIARAQDVDYIGECIDEVNYPTLDKIDFTFTNPLEFKYKVMFTDTDHNGHMNNAKYADLILNILNLAKEYQYKELQIDFINEVLLGEEMIISYEKVADKYYFEAKVLDKVCMRAMMEVTTNE